MKKGITGSIKVFRLSNNCAKKSDPRLAWIMLLKISHMYRDTRKQETVQASLLIQGLHVNFESTKAIGTSPATPNLYMSLQPTMHLESTTVPKYPEEIQPQSSQVWNCDEIACYPNGSCIQVVCTYKFFTGDRICRTQTREIAPF